MNLADKLESWAQNEEMIDQYYLEHGRDCNLAAEVLRQAELYVEQFAHEQGALDLLAKMRGHP